MSAVLGLVLTVGRSQLSGLEFAGEPLFVHACRVLAGISDMRTVLVTDRSREEAKAAWLGDLPGVEISELEDVEFYLRTLVGDGVVLLHDPLCPLTPASWVRSLLDQAAESGAVLVAVRPVVDTLKTSRDCIITGTIDRAGLQILSSPMVFPAAALIAEPELIPLLADPVGLVERLRVRYDVKLVDAPSTAQRVEDPAGLELLAAVASAQG
jgi:2-C-methyl-D-erythritol 4-phosphate cytidylyltransferase